MFDDHGNIQENSQLRITKLNTENITSAALSGHAGPLKRPIAMLSFALNYYFANGYQYFAFKITNVIIQIVCSWFLFIFCKQLISLTKISHLKTNSVTFIAFSMAMLWATHPINLTSVLYVVQRMTSLSTLFTLATLIFYIHGRNITDQTKHFKHIFFYFLSFISFLLAIFSKENALLIPAYILLLEWVFYGHKLPWSKFSSLSIGIRNKCYFALIISFCAFLLFAIDYASNGYNNRTFTLTERVLTEARVVCFYISLIVLPRINAFGLFHDDIPVSTSIVAPWTTLPSIALIIGLIIIAIRLKPTKPLFTFGVLFFFTGHLLESTIFGLEIAHEHRNHLASIGILIALTSLFIHQQELNKKYFSLVISVCIVIFSATTMLRTFEWKNDYTLALYESEHHPESPATLALLSNTAYKYQNYNVAETAINKARKIQPLETSYAINSVVIATLLNKPINDTLIEEVKTKIRANPFSTSTQISLAHISKHFNNDAFKPLQAYFIEWLEILLQKIGGTQQASIYHYFLAKSYLATGNTLGAINSHQQAFNLDKNFINPLFEMGNIFLALKQTKNANIVLSQIETANANPDINRRYDMHIQELKDAIRKIDCQKP